MPAARYGGMTWTRDWRKASQSSLPCPAHNCFHQAPAPRARTPATREALATWPSLAERRSEERRVGKSVDLGGRRIIKKKKPTTAKKASSTRTESEGALITRELGGVGEADDQQLR